MIYKKSVVLNSVCGGVEKGVLTLETTNGDTIGTVKLYNFTKEPEGILSVGILNGNDVVKAGLTIDDSGVYHFKLNGEKNFTCFSCAVVNFVRGEAKPILHGATGQVPTTEERLANCFDVFDNSPTVQKVEKVLDDNGIVFDDQEEIEKNIANELNFNNNTCQNHCSECKYRDAFFKQEDMPYIEKEEKEDSFFDGIKEQIETLFDKFPEEEILKQIIPDSKWCKIDNEEKNEYYVVGLLYENDHIKYVCYGVPSMFNDEPPQDLKGFAQWLPIDSSKEQGFGYWITYQDAETGENIKMEFETI